jgi:hypothetical protein
MNLSKSAKELCNLYFRFLIDEFGFKQVKNKSETWGREIVFKNSSTAVSLLFESREFRLFMYVHRLLNGEIAPKEKIGPNSTIHSFEFDDVVIHFDKTAFIPPYEPSTPLNEFTLENHIKRKADNLKMFGKNILLGDFSLFPVLEKKVKERAREFDFQQWGPEAKKFGWL